MPRLSTRDGTELYYKDWGSGRPVILIHGWPLSADSWDDQAKAIADAGMRAIAYDRRGFGRSDQPFTGYDYDTLADDLADVIKETGVTNDAALVGFSMGGGEVARYLAKYGAGGVSRAALVGAVVPYLLQSDDNPDGVPREVFDTMVDGISKDRAAFFATFFKTFFGVGFITSPVSDELLQMAWNVAMTAGLEPTLACVRAFSETDFRRDLAAFTMPTLIIHGTSDKTVPIAPTARAAARAIPGATLIEYDGAPHGLFATEKERFTRDLIDFLQPGAATGFMLRGQETAERTAADPLAPPILDRP